MAAARQKKQQLPTWDLKDLYPGPNSAALKKDLAKAKKDSAPFTRNISARSASCRAMRWALP